MVGEEGDLEDELNTIKEKNNNSDMQELVFI